MKKQCTTDAKAGSSKRQAGNERCQSGQRGVGIPEAAWGSKQRAEICRFSPCERSPVNPSNSWCYPRAAVVGFLARLLEPRPDRSVTNS